MNTSTCVPISFGRLGAPGGMTWLALSCECVCVCSQPSLGRPGAPCELLNDVSCDLILLTLLRSTRSARCDDKAASV